MVLVAVNSTIEVFSLEVFFFKVIYQESTSFNVFLSVSFRVTEDLS